MKKLIQVVVALLVAALWSLTLVQAKPEYSKAEKKPCTTCHVKMGAKELNDTGKCYQEKKSLKECPIPGKKDK